MTAPFLQDTDLTIYVGDALDVLRELPAGAAHACVTSPPYLDARPEYPSPTPAQFGLIFGELRRVVAGPMILNVGRLWRGKVEQLWWMTLLDIARHHEWQLLDTLLWLKPNANPIHGQVFANSHEYVLILGEPGAVLNTDAIRTGYAEASIGRMGRRWVNGRGVKGDARGDQQGREMNEAGARARSFVTFSVGKAKGNEHPAPMPLELAEYLVSFASFPGQTVIDPFGGSGTTAVAARRLERHSILIELDESYAKMAAARLGQQSLLTVDA